MKECPSCGASVPDSAAQCPSCRHEFEAEDADEKSSGETMLGMPSNNLPGARSDDEEEASGDDETGGRDAQSTQFGMPATGGDDAGESSPEIDTSASGPDEGARDWSDLDEDLDDGGDDREERSTEFGLPAADDESPGLPDSEGGVSEAPSDGEQEGGDWSDLNEAAADEPSEGSILSAWGVDDEGGSTSTESPTAETTSAEGAESGETSGGDAGETGDREERKTQMGMPRFDPDRVADEEGDGDEAEIGDEETAPGGPHESVEAPSVEGSQSEELPEDATQQVDIGSLKQQVEDLESDGDESRGAQEDVPSGSGGSEPEDRSPGSRVVRESTETPEAAEEGDEEPAPSATLHGKAGKAAGSGYREPEQPEHSSDVIESGEASSGADDPSESAVPGDAEADDDEDERTGTLGGLPGEDLEAIAAGETEDSGGGSPEESDERSEPEQDDDRSPRSTRIGQPVAAPSTSDEPPSTAESEGSADPQSQAPGEEDSEAPPEQSASGSVRGSENENAAPEEPADESQDDGDDGLSLPSPGEVDEEEGGGPLDGLGLESQVEDFSTEDDGRDRSPPASGTASGGGVGGDLESPGEDPSDVDGADEMGVELDQESSSESFFEEIEEDVVSELEERELEEVDFDESDAEAGEAFDFDGFAAPEAPEGEEPESDAPPEQREPEREEAEREAPSDQKEPAEDEGESEELGLEMPDELQGDAAEATRQVDRPEQMADEMELTEPGGAPGIDTSDRSETPDRALDAVEEPAAPDSEVPGEQPPPAGPEAQGPGTQEPGEPPAEPEPAPVTPEEGSGGAVQSVIGVIAGLTMLASLGLQTMTTDLVGHYLVLSLTVASGLGGAVSLVVPFLGSNARTRSILYLGFGTVVAALAVSVVALVAQQLALAPILALSGGILAVGAGLAPAMQ